MLELYAEVSARRLRTTEQPCGLTPRRPVPLHLGKGGPSSANGRISLIGNCAKRAPSGEMAARAAASNCLLSILTFPEGEAQSARHWRVSTCRLPPFAGVPLLAVH